MTAIADFNGPDVPLGFVKPTASGTPIQITNTIDPAGSYAPEVSNRAGGPLYPPFRFQQLLFIGKRPKAGGGAEKNTGDVYIIRRGYTRLDLDGLVGIVGPGEIFSLASAPRVSDTFDPYRYWIDNDNDDDGVYVVGIKQG